MAWSTCRRDVQEAGDLGIPWRGTVGPAGGREPSPQEVPYAESIELKRFTKGAAPEASKCRIRRRPADNTFSSP